MDPNELEKLEIRSAAELWDWLEAHHTRPDGIWLVTWKAADRTRYVSRDDVLDPLIAYGWIDGRRMKLDDRRTMQLIAPRRQQIWAESYKRRAASLESEGRMRPPGFAAISRARASRHWDALADVDALIVPDDLNIALSENGALPWWEAAAPSYRRNVLRWVAGAQRPATRAKRVAAAADHAARGEKVPQY